MNKRFSFSGVTTKNKGRNKNNRQIKRKKDELDKLLFYGSIVDLFFFYKLN